MMTIMEWLKTETRQPLGDAAQPSRPALETLFAFYLSAFAPIRVSSAQPVVDFVEVLRQYDKTKVYSDEEWIPFFMQFTGGDPDAARDMWDGFVCQ
jgi:hypothetical protein